MVALRRTMVQLVMHFPDMDWCLDFFLYEPSKPTSILLSIFCTKKETWLNLFMSSLKLKLAIMLLGLRLMHGQHSHCGPHLIQPLYIFRWRKHIKCTSRGWRSRPSQWSNVTICSSSIDHRVWISTSLPRGFRITKSYLYSHWWEPKFRIKKEKRTHIETSNLLYVIKHLQTHIL